MSKYIFILFLLISIYCNDDIKNKTGNTTKKVIDSKKPFNLTIDEIDTMMVCSIIMEEKTKKYSSKIENIQKKFKISTPELVSNKISAEIFEKCNKLITIKEVNKYIKNLTLVKNFEWEKNFDKISEINFDKYKNISDLEYTVNQQVLMYNFQKAEEVFILLRNPRRGNRHIMKYLLPGWPGIRILIEQRILPVQPEDLINIGIIQNTDVIMTAKPCDIHHRTYPGFLDSIARNVGMFSSWRRPSPFVSSYRESRIKPASNCPPICSSRECEN